MNKNITFLIMLISAPLYADLGVMDTVSETNAKTGASGLGITQIWDHPAQVANGTFYVPVEYNRTNAEGNGGEVDPNYSGKSDIDYIPLSQLKGTNGSNGVIGNQGAVGETGQKGDKGDKGNPGRDATVETRVLFGAAVQVASERYYDVHMFADYDVTNGKVGFVGARILFKPGESYESRQMKKLQKQIDALTLKLEVAE